MIWAAISFKIKVLSIFMLWDEDNETYGYSARSYKLALEDGILPMYQPSQPFQQDNTYEYIVNMAQDWHEKHGIWVMD